MDRLDRQRRISGWNQGKLSGARINLFAPPQVDPLLLDAFVRGCAMIGIGRVEVFGEDQELEIVDLIEFSRRIDSQTLIDYYPGEDWKWFSRKERGTLTVNLAFLPPVIEEGSYVSIVNRCQFYAQVNSTRGLWCDSRSQIPDMDGEPRKENPIRSLPLVTAGALLAEVTRFLLPDLDRWRHSHLLKPIFFPPSHHEERSAQPGLNLHRLVMVGAGALGNWLAYALMHDWIAHSAEELIIIDRDRIEYSNLNRQVFFTREDVGKSKALRLAEHLNPAFPGIHVRGITDHVESESFFSATDRLPTMILSCVDSWRTRALLNRIAVKDRIPLLNGGTDPWSCNIYGYFPEKTPCLNCVLSVTRRAEAETEATSCAAVEPSVVFTNMIAAGLMATAFHRPCLFHQGILQYDLTIPERIGFTRHSGENKNCTCLVAETAKETSATS